MAKISVVIPAYNCKDAMIKGIDALFSAKSADGHEVIVVDDGSTDGTKEALSAKAAISHGKLRSLSQNHLGPAAARNLGIKNAGGDIILLLGADTIADDRLITSHLDGHEQYPQKNTAVLGHIAWATGIRLTPFLKWLEQGAQFGYPVIKDPGNVPYDFFYSSNISLKKSFLIENGLFDEDFPYAAYEDIELGCRLSKAGLRIVYDPAAIAYHDHIMDQESFALRSRRTGESLKVFHDKHPELKAGYRSPKGKVLELAVSALVWKVPQALAWMVPKKLLYGCYGHMISRFVYDGYSSAGTRKGR